MKGIVIHHQGKIWRSLEGRVSTGRLAIETINSVPMTPKESSRGCTVQRPVYFVFSLRGRTFAASQNVMLRKGRRYPDVEHWFVLSESRQNLELNELQQASATPI